MSFAIGGPIFKWTNLGSKSADYTILDDDNYGIILITDTSTDRNVTLPTASANTDREILIKNTSTDKGKVTIDGEGAETIDGQATIDLDFKNSYIKLICDGTGWQIIDTNLTSRLKTYSLTCESANWASEYAYGTPFRDILGNWFIDFRACMDRGSEQSMQTVDLAVTGITAKNTGYEQALAIYGRASVFSDTRTFFAAIQNNSGTVSCYSTAAQTNRYLSVNGIIMLESKPTFVE